jgi:shikimate kinase/3-dehydroquinate synthase
MAFVLIGFMGAGKSTAAVDLADALGVEPIDSDRLLAERLGHPPAREFELHGEESFREKEQQLVCELLAGAGPSDVIALGGGSVTSEKVRDALADHVSVLLEVDPHAAWERVSRSRDAATRPLARDRDQFLALYRSRLPVYEQVADAFVPGAVRRVISRASQALQALAAAPAGTRLLWAHSRSGEYPVLIGRGLLAPGRPDVLRRIWPVDLSSSTAYCVSDRNVQGLYEGRLQGVRDLVAIAPGEGHKTLASAELVWQALVVAGATRADHLVAFGGGVVGDLTGFCAATYQRGVPVVHLPTTLVSQVDSAYGGKTGVDLPAAKNYVGAYHQPAGVLVDPDTLDSLPAAELSAGWVEVLKTALISGGELWETVRAGGDTDQETIVGCARAKLAVVAADERDSGRRQVLNLGHTVGHAIETATGYGRYRHGEAVGLGLLAALRLSGLEDLRAEVADLLLARGLPVTFQGASELEVLQALSRDKKRLGENVPFVLVREPGDVVFGCELEQRQVHDAVEEIAR